MRADQPYFLAGYFRFLLDRVLQLFRPHFGSVLRLRGQDYFYQGKVHVLQGDEHSIQAHVDGTRRYTATIQADGERVAMQCECEAFLKNPPCKHLWALLLAAAAKEFLSSLTIRRNVDIVYGAVGPNGKPGESWKQWVAELHALESRFPSHAPAPPPSPTPVLECQIVYSIDVAATLESAGIVLRILRRRQLEEGGWAHPEAMSRADVRNASQAPGEDRDLLQMLLGARTYTPQNQFETETTPISRILISYELANTLIPRIARQKRLWIQTESGESSELAWDGDVPWSLHLAMTSEGTEMWRLKATLQRADARMDMVEPELMLPDGLIFSKAKVWRLDQPLTPSWLKRLRRGALPEVSEQEAPRFLANLVSTPGAPSIFAPSEWRYQRRRADPSPLLRLRVVASFAGKLLESDVFFNYEGTLVSVNEPDSVLLNDEDRSYLERDRGREMQLLSELSSEGLQVPRNIAKPMGGSGWGQLDESLLEGLMNLAKRGWRIELEGKPLRTRAESRLSVSSGIDWFELHTDLSFDEQQADPAALAEAIQKESRWIRLADGSLGRIPDAWMKRVGELLGFARFENGAFRFPRMQALLLDALLSEQEETNWDEKFGHVRQQVEQFRQLKPLEQPTGFEGTLRPYQREGLAWLQFLRQVELGGILADDMGLGKTAQILGWLDMRREAGASCSLVVVPRSLIFNWKEEAARFTPNLRVVDASSPTRHEVDLTQADVALCTYGIVRRDIQRLRDFEFDTIVLDEAQAIKNSTSDISKASRLLRAKHKLAMSGTPIENHLGELWSLFEFLNPGMLGAARHFQNLMRVDQDQELAMKQVVLNSVRPLILRRTKEQVAQELPPRTEQILMCDMTPEQSRIYQRVRQHFKKSLSAQVESEGLEKSKMHVLEALLRLRQVACHPALAGSGFAGAGSGKLDLLFEQLEEIIASGHKALVVSQFTKFLAHVQAGVEQRKMGFEYLDGKTRDREQRVHRFQNDPKCSLFLISLKAGGVGLNLTAASYVLLLDPWWNPAVEAQAIGRAHRIGQNRPVFAYRFVTSGTVEEKILELQRSKRELAESILESSSSLLSDLKREDLEMLLS